MRSDKDDTMRAVSFLVTLAVVFALFVMTMSVIIHHEVERTRGQESSVRYPYPTPTYPDLRDR